MTTTEYTWPAEVRARVDRLVAELGDGCTITVEPDSIGYWHVHGTSSDGLTTVRIAISDAEWREVKS